MLLVLLLQNNTTVVEKVLFDKSTSRGIITSEHICNGVLLASGFHTVNLSTSLVPLTTICAEGYTTTHTVILSASYLSVEVSSCSTGAYHIQHGGP